MPEGYEAPGSFGDFTGALPDQSVVEKFRQIIRDYYQRFGRTMPWRETRDPYAILVSEIMLQQTQVSRVVPKYQAFLARWPDIGALAAADLRQVLALWQGLGYNRRGQALHRSARIVRDKFSGTVPAGTAELSDLPGVGPATASAVRSFAYDIPAVYLETNVRRVYLHFFFCRNPRVTDRELLAVASTALDTADSRSWNFALMDYGVFLKEERPNDNKRSATYSRQSRFEGSDRQIRGRVVAYLVDHGESPQSDLIEALPFERDRILRCAEGLAREGMIAESPGGYAIAAPN